MVFKMLSFSLSRTILLLLSLLYGRLLVWNHSNTFGLEFLKDCPNIAMLAKPQNQILK